MECSVCGLAPCDLPDGIDPEMVFERVDGQWLCQADAALDQPGDQEDGTTWVRVPRAWLQIEDGRTYLTQGGHSFGPLPGDQEGTT